MTHSHLQQGTNTGVASSSNQLLTASLFLNSLNGRQAREGAGFLFKDITVRRLLKVGGKPAAAEAMKALMVFWAMLFHPEFKACSLFSKEHSGPFAPCLHWQGQCRGYRLISKAFIFPEARVVTSLQQSQCDEVFSRLWQKRSSFL